MGKSSENTIISPHKKRGSCRWLWENRRYGSTVVGSCLGLQLCVCLRKR